MSFYMDQKRGAFLISLWWPQGLAGLSRGVAGFSLVFTLLDTCAKSGADARVRHATWPGSSRY